MKTKKVNDPWLLDDALIVIRTMQPETRQVIAECEARFPEYRYQRVRV